MWQSSSSSTNLLAVPSAKFCFCFWEKVKTYWPTDQPGLLTEVHGGGVCVCVCVRGGPYVDIQWIRNQSQPERRCLQRPSAWINPKQRREFTPDTITPRLTSIEHVV